MSNLLFVVLLSLIVFFDELLDIIFVLEHLFVPHKEGVRLVQTLSYCRVNGRA
jgi:hypothetical protein